MSMCWLQHMLQPVPRRKIIVDIRFETVEGMWSNSRKDEHVRPHCASIEKTPHKIEMSVTEPFRPSGLGEDAMYGWHMTQCTGFIQLYKWGREVMVKERLRGEWV